MLNHYPSFKYHLIWKRSCIFFAWLNIILKPALNLHHYCLITPVWNMYSFMSWWLWMFCPKFLLGCQLWSNLTLRAPLCFSLFLKPYICFLNVFLHLYKPYIITIFGSRPKPKFYSKIQFQPRVLVLFSLSLAPL